MGDQPESFTRPYQDLLKASPKTKSIEASTVARPGTLVSICVLAKRICATAYLKYALCRTCLFGGAWDK